MRDRTWRLLTRLGIRFERFRPSWDDCDFFTIKVRMRKRWTPHFLGMLKTMEQYGNWGCSRTLSFYADGDGDFRPKFRWPSRLETAQALRDEGGDRFWDAG